MVPHDGSTRRFCTAALIAVGLPEQLPFHANRAMDNGLTRTEASEVVTHVAFYAGWPRAMSAVRVLGQVFESRDKPKLVALAMLAPTGAAVVFGAGFVVMLLLGMFRHPKCKQLYIKIVQAH